MKWLNCSKPTAINTANKLVKKKLITKRQESNRGVLENRYGINWETVESIREGVKKLDKGGKKTLQGGGKEILPRGGKKTLPNNIVNSITNYDSTNNKYFPENGKGSNESLQEEIPQPSNPKIETQKRKKSCAKKRKFPMSNLYDAFNETHKEIFESAKFYSPFSWGTGNRKAENFSHMRNTCILIEEDISKKYKIKKEEVEDFRIVEAYQMIMRMAKQTENSYYIANLEPLGIYRNYNRIKQDWLNKFGTKNEVNEEQLQKAFS